LYHYRDTQRNVEGENEAEKPDNLDKYLPFTINRDEVADMKKVLYEHLHLNDDPRDLITRLISSPRIGLTSRQLESAELKSRTENDFTKYPSVTYFANGWES
jgi:hypothetical protein